LPGAGCFFSGMTTANPLSWNYRSMIYGTIVP
jgi:hypothetical protein